MNKTEGKIGVAMVGGAVLGSVLSRNIDEMLPANSSFALNLGLAAASGFGATKVTGTGTKENMLRGALLGSCVMQVFTATRKFAVKHLADKIEGDSASAKAIRASLGLACPEERGLNGAMMMGADGNLYQMDEAGLNGTYMDENGNVFQQADGLNGAEAHIYGQEEEMGLNGVDAVLEAELYN